ncbi:MFS transporter [Oleiagrimonas soli]|uniref:MFS family permease n=1 Tax=Oleiagrimonas soli TaxID=1543381 RepID=A0A099CWP1_9GAMM|nr:MFS transporter [Oleiagrimonas soli]KGI77430.1 MFS transporter [Oleiagrimonas soli]MBB6183129.1 MFS family permease [Oleiagrimonas soli]
MKRAFRALRGLPSTVWLLGLISLVNDSASDMIYPLVPLYLASVLMAGPRALGLIEGVAEALSSLLKLVAGVLSDRMRSMRLWVIGGYAVAGLARPLIGLAQSWLGVFGARLLDRVGRGFRAAPRDAMLRESVPAHRRGLAFGLHRAMDNTGAVIGPLIAAGLLAAGLSLRQVFLCAIVPAVVVLILTFRLKDPEPDQVPVMAGMRWNPASLPPALRRYLLALTLFTLGNSSNMFLLLRAQDLGTDTERVVLMWALFSGVAAVFSTPLSALSDRFGRVRVLGAAWCAYALAYLTLGLLPATGWTLWMSFAGYGLVMAALEGTEKALVADLVDSGRAGTAFGWYNLVAGLMLLPASIVFGALWQSISPLAAFAFGAVCSGSAALLLLTWVRRGIARSQ